jgi:hypothetical protein
VLALIAEMAEDAVRRAAFEKAWVWYGGSELTNDLPLMTVELLALS